MSPARLFTADRAAASDRRPFQPGRDAAPSGEPATAGDEGSPARDHGRARFVICFKRGSGQEPALQGFYLRREGGFLHVCASAAQAERYDLPYAARDVATRAERAFPGARLAVLPVIA